MEYDKKNNTSKLRYNLIKILVCTFGAILILQLFNLQIINGQEFREQSNTRLTRETVLEAARGGFYDRNNNLIVGAKMGFSLELYRSKVSTETLNKSILNIIEILEKNDDKYYDNLPIQINPFRHTFSDKEEFEKWKKNNDIDKDANPEECFYALKEEYEITNGEIEEIRKILAIRYEITRNGYSATRPLTIAKNISRQSAIELSEQEIELGGINIVIQPIRNYISGSLASHIIGYIGRITEPELETRKDTYSSNDYIGKTGLEYVLEEYLKGKNGIKQIDMDVEGNITEEYIYEEAVAGSDVILTIDANLQRVVEDALRDNIEKIRSGGFSKSYDAQGGAVVVMDVKTGEILALASYPDFEPELFINTISNAKWNEYRETQALFNRATQGAYAPGSIFKMVTAIAGLEERKITTREEILTKGKYPLAHKPVCWVYTDYGTTHGRINVSEAIKYSCNYFFYDVGNRIGIEPIEKYAKYFGLGTKTGIELPAETSGTLASRENLEKKGETWNLGNTLSAAIGQGQNNFSPIQMARYISMLTNGGKVITPTLIKQVINADGTIVDKNELQQFINNKLNLTQEEQQNLDIKKENLDAVLEGMKSVTGDADGTAYGSFSDFEIEVGGKTGSAEAGEYTNGWFAGFAPFDNPEIAIICMVENANKGSYVAEIARKIMDEYFGLNDIETTEDTKAQQYTQINN